MTDAERQRDILLAELQALIAAADGHIHWRHIEVARAVLKGVEDQMYEQPEPEVTERRLGERGVWIQEDRDAIHTALRSVAERLLQKRSWRNSWRVEIEKCVFKFKIEGYAKAHSPIWNEQQAEIKAALDAFDAECGDQNEPG